VGGLAVLHVVQSPDYGVPRVASRLAADQADRGWRVTVACPPGNDAGKAAEALGIPRYPWDATRSPGPGSLAETRRLAEIVGRADPDVVHLHSAKPGLAGRLAMRGRRPTVFQPHAWSFTAVRGPMRAATVCWERIAARWAHAIVCVSADERRSGEAAGVRGRYVVVPNGVDLERFTPATQADRATARRSLGLGDEPLAVLPARLFRQKGQDVLLRAWPLVLERVPGARLALVGDGPEEDSLRALGVPGVRFFGPSDDVQAWLAAATVVVLPSRWEAGLSLIAMEAMARARSVVATDVWGTREGLSKGGGAVVPVEAVGPLADAVADRLADPVRADTDGSAGRRRVEAAYDLRIANERMAELYDSVVKKASAGGPINSA
jgi:glycosyltransferase involved in cell wall biosynthesis